MSQDIQYINILNDDKTPYDYAISVLKQVFNKTEEEAIEIAKMIDLSGKVTVFKGPAQEIECCLEKLKMYNEMTKNDLKAERSDQPFVFEKSEKFIEEMTVSSPSVTLKLNLYREEDPYSLFKVIRSVFNENPSQEDRALAKDLLLGKEVIIQEFENDKNGLDKAQMAQELIQNRIKQWSKEDDGNFTIQVRNIGDRLEIRQSPLPNSDQFFKKETKNALLDLALEFADVAEAQTIEKYGSIENFLKNGSPKEIEDYQYVQEAKKEIDDLASEKEPKQKSPKP